MSEKALEKKVLKNRPVNGLLMSIKRNIGILVGLAILCTIISINSPVFLTTKNIMNVLRQISANLFVACGMTIILIAGGIDLSVGSTIAVIGVAAASFLDMGLPVPLTVLACLALGAFVGFINGFIISRTKITPFIVTLSMANVLRGLAYVYTGATTIRINDRGYINIGTGFLGPVPLPAIYIVVVLIIVYLILNKSRLGRHIYAIGGNEKAARFSGIDVKKVRLFIYIFSGLMAAVASITLSARSYSGNPTAGEGAEMDAIAAVVLGGISMAGGNGHISGTIIGALIIGVINNGLNLMGIHSFWQMILKGIIILVAVYADYMKNAKSNKASEA
jgi:ribose transport system permease protein